MAEDDDMSMFFAPTNRKKKEQESSANALDDDDFLDSIFASKHKADNAPPRLPQPDAGLEPPDEDLRDDKSLGLDALFVKPAQRPAGNAPAADAQSFSDLFHTPARR